jgi:hypothetical protein
MIAKNNTSVKTNQHMTIAKDLPKSHHSRRYFSAELEMKKYRTPDHLRDMA